MSKGGKQPGAPGSMEGKMDFRDELMKKTVTVEEAVLSLKDGDHTQMYGTSAEPATFLGNLGLLRGKRRDVTLVHFLGTQPFDFYSDESYRGVINYESMFCARFYPAAQKKGLVTYVPSHLSKTAADRLEYLSRRGRSADVYVVSCCPMDRHGYFSTSTVGMSNRELVRNAKRVIVELNESLPRTFGDSYVHISEVDMVFQGDNKLITLPEAPVDDEDRAIGGYIAELIDDGATLQLGIGGIPNAVADALRTKKDLGVHTEMICEGLAMLSREGVITNRRKTYFNGKMVATFSFGGKGLYDFLDDNVGVLHLDVGRVNAPHEIAKNHNYVSINTTLQIDLMGQCASEAIGTLQISGIGGQTDTVMGAKMSPGGKSVMALHSTAEVKGEDGGKKRISKIVPVHGPGTIISLLRADVDYVVTEFGIADLCGASVRERAKSLIAIAHPDFRAELTEEAERLFLAV